MNIPIRAWNIVFLIGFITYCGIRGVFKRRTEGNEKILRRLDALEKCLLTGVGVGSLLLPVLYLLTPWLAFADYHLPACAPWFGALLMLPALWLFYRSHADLGQNWSVTLELRKGHQVIKQGVYRSIRHPMYASIFLWDVAQGLLLQNWLAGWGALATFAVLYLVRMPREERMMCEFFGQEYRDYMRQTGRLFPSLGFQSRSNGGIS
jgi:protein-S-isoprenylcysteine O-methyltransferase Ste14